MGMPVREWVERMRTAHERVELEELRRGRLLSQQERIAATQAASALARRTLDAMSPEVRARALAHRDPLPESSVRALARLRASAQGKPRD